MEEQPKSIKVHLNYVGEDGTASSKKMSIKINTAVLREKPSVFTSVQTLVYKMSFSLTIPEHVHSFLLGKTVPMNKIGNRDESKDYKSDFAKTIKCDTIEALTQTWYDVMADYQWLKKIESAELKKVIFYDFDAQQGGFKSKWNGMSFGKHNELAVKYAIGYISDVNGKIQRYNHLKKLISTTYDNDFYTLEYVEWTEERQVYFESIQNSFETLISKMNLFKESLSEETINKIINAGTKLLG